jgi:hypothetical protein
LSAFLLGACSAGLTPASTNPNDPAGSRIGRLADGNLSVRVKAADELAGLGEPGLAALLAAMQSGEPAVRCTAAGALGKFKDPRAVDSLTASLKDTSSYSNAIFGESFYVRDCAADALGKIGDPRAVEPLLVEMNDPDAGHRCRVAVALGKIKDRRAAGSLIAALSDTAYHNYRDVVGRSYVRACAANALGEINDPRGLEAVLALLKDPEPRIRFDGACALQFFKDPRVTEAAIPLLKDMARFDEHDFSLAVPKDFHGAVRHCAAHSLVVIAQSGDRRAVSALREAVIAKDPVVTLAAYAFFINAGDQASEGALIEGLRLTGNVQMAQDYLNCGNEKLEDAAREWASAFPRLRIVQVTGGAAPVRWGSAPVL